ncbi:MAG: UvrD-helicase domain-containing protein [Solirubrobacteraceae bacterium]
MTGASDDSVRGLDQPLEFDVCGPLPTGVTVLEASAGTGKTYTIAALAARYVADGIPLERLLLVTFTRIATGELRDRVRERLLSAEQGLARALAGVLPGADRLVALLATGSEREVRLRRQRLARAVASFDAATIATTHGFCQEVLGGLGIAGDLEPDVTFVEDLGDLVADVVDDLYIRRFSPSGSPAFGRAQAAEIARVAIDNPAATIVSSADERPAMRGRLAQAVRDEFEARKRGLGVMTYDDLVTRLSDALSGERGEAAARQLHQRFRVVLVDEFQDTDPAQWAILRRAFGDASVTLVLIADPKQAIYAFRGADVYAYLEAAQAADARATLGTNWRSDANLVAAHDALLAGVKLGHEGIAYRQVRAAPGHEGSRLIGAPAPAPLRVRVAQREDPAVSLTPGGNVQKASGREHVCLDLAADVVALLDGDASIERRGYDGEVVGADPVRAGHIAVLVRTNRQAAMIRDALDQLGVPAVINGAGSVFATEPAREWLRLLEALERPASVPRAHSVALTPFLGWTAERLAAADDDGWAWEEVHRRLHDWARVLRDRGVASLVETISLVEGLPARVLSGIDGERRLTDLRHVGQLLHAAASEAQMGTTTLTAWLRTRVAQAENDTADEERSRRLESDAEAVQVLTIHRSKGLEFPIVYLPFLWEPGYISDQLAPVFFHDPQAGDARKIDVALEGADYAAHREQFVREQRGEDLRLAYVALTRARHQVVLWWAGSYDSRNSPLCRLLFARDERGDIAPSCRSVPDDAAVVERLRSLGERAPGCVGIERAELGLRAVWSPPAPEKSELRVAAFDRGLDLRWRRTSYSDITAASHESWVTSEPEDPLLDDEPGDETPAPDRSARRDPAPADAEADADDAAASAQASLLAGLPAGVEVGTFVHRVLEATDFAAADLEVELRGRVIEARQRRGVEIGDPAAVVTGLAAALQTPLGPVLDGVRLADVSRADRLDELGFELPLVGGETPTGVTGPSRIAAVLREFIGPDDPLAGYAERLQDSGLRSSVRGFLTGSLDLVIRLPAASAGSDSGVGTRYAVLDYKTNWLGELDEPLTLESYRPALIAAEMQRRHYALQALLYLVALHRFLRWRVPGTEPAGRLAGVVYLFLRGMSGPATPVRDGSPYGVFGWQPPPGLVPALSDALDGQEDRR